METPPQNLVPLTDPEKEEAVIVGDDSLAEDPTCPNIGRHRLPPPKPNHGEKEWRPPFGQ